MDSSTSFRFDGDVLDYCIHPYNDARKNERAVEIPLALRYIERYGIDLEVGNVLSHYGTDGHRVVDRYEGPEYLDVFDLTERVSSIVTISTLEHVRWDEPVAVDHHAAHRALEHLRTLADHLFVTVPFGWNPHLDAYILTEGVGSTVVATGPRWQQTEDIEWRPYGKRTIWAEAVWIGEFHDSRAVDSVGP